MGPASRAPAPTTTPTPGPAGERFLYGHVFVSAAALARHPRWGSVALPLRPELYVRAKDQPKLPPERQRPFRTKLRLAAALLALPVPKPPGRPGPQATYGKQRVSLAMRVGQRRGWQAVECEQYGPRVVKKVKTFLATWRPAGGVIRVVLVEEEDGWLPYFCTDPDASVVEVLGAAADRGAHEQAFKELSTRPADHVDPRNRANTSSPLIFRDRRAVAFRPALLSRLLPPSAGARG